MRLLRDPKKCNRGRLELDPKFAIRGMFVLFMIWFIGWEPQRQSDRTLLVESGTKTADRWAEWFSGGAYKGSNLDEQARAKAQFSKKTIDEVARSVVGVGFHEQRVPDSWFPARSGFSVGPSGLNPKLTQILTVAFDGWDTSPHIHVYRSPYLLPPGRNAVRAFTTSFDGSGIVFAICEQSVAAAELAPMGEINFDSKFPVAIAGVNGQVPTTFFTHSIGRRSGSLVQLSEGPRDAIGHLAGAAVINRSGQIVGVYRPRDRQPEYIASDALHGYLHRPINQIK